jgi:hypothetical protein
MNDETRAAKFWAKVDPNGPVSPRLSTRCWLWTGYATGGAGIFYAGNGVRVRAHRFSWLLSGGLLLSGAEIRPLCGRRRYVNPEHLYQQLRGGAR